MEVLLLLRCLLLLCTDLVYSVMPADIQRMLSHEAHALRLAERCSILLWRGGRSYEVTIIVRHTAQHERLCGCGRTYRVYNTAYEM